jgi:hypothetical protein
VEHWGSAHTRPCADVTIFFPDEEIGSVSDLRAGLIERVRR